MADATDVPPPQFDGGGPTVVVRNTFLDIDDRPPVQGDLIRVSTAPPLRQRRGDPSDSEDDDDTVTKTSQMAENPSAAGEDDDEGAPAPGPVAPQFNGGGPTVLVRNTFLDIDDDSPPVQGDLFRCSMRPTTRDRHEQQDEWSWAHLDAPPVFYAIPPPPQAPQQATPNFRVDAAPPVFYQVPAPPPVPSQSAPGNASVIMVPMLVPVDLTTGAPIGPMQAVVPDRTALWPAAMPRAPAAGQTMPSSALVQNEPPPLLDVRANVAGGSGGYSGSTESPPQRHNLTRTYSHNSGKNRVHWTFDAKKLRGRDPRAVSPSFEIFLGGHFQNATFRMMMYPRKGCGSFTKAKGKGYIQLKCEAELNDAIASVCFRLSIGSGRNMQPHRGPVTHNFSQSAVCGLEEEDEEWDFGAVVDADSQTFVVCLELVPCA